MMRGNESGDEISGLRQVTAPSESSFISGSRLRVMKSADATTPRAMWRQDGNVQILELAGDWHRGGGEVVVSGKASGQSITRYQTDALGSFDSILPAFLLANLRSHARGESGLPSLEGLPADLRGLLELALEGPEELADHGGEGKPPAMMRLGKLSLNVWSATKDVVEFIGQCSLSLVRWITGRARFRSKDLWVCVQECGVEALPIVTLISFLIGMILAFVGNAQLTNFGANLLVADLVAIAMVREMGVVMTAIIMSGRTGAAFAAHIGSMKSNEEIDALRTAGFDPFDFLVLPRLLGLVLMMPLLTVYSNVIGILGGMLVGSLVGIPAVLFWNETLLSITLTTSMLGVIKSVFFGAVIAISGCMQGMRAGKSSAAVGEATTHAIVASITWIVVLDSAFAAIFTLLGI
jgi:phospholipid/cholesterol/gamma-HCH transport system permease protein